MFNFEGHPSSREKTARGSPGHFWMERVLKDPRPSIFKPLDPCSSVLVSPSFRSTIFCVLDPLDLVVPRPSILDGLDTYTRSSTLSFLAPGSSVFDPALSIVGPRSSIIFMLDLRTSSLVPRSSCLVLQSSLSSILGHWCSILSILDCP